MCLYFLVNDMIACVSYVISDANKGSFLLKD